MTITRGRVCLLGFLWLLLSSTAYWAGFTLIDLDLTKGHIAAGDGFFYYEYLPSLVSGKPFDFCETRKLMEAEGMPYDWSNPLLRETKTGRCATPFTIGWAILVAPFFFLAYMTAQLINPVYPMRLDGLGFYYESITVYGAVILGFLSLVFLYRLSRLSLSRGRAAMIALAAFAATNAVYYAVVQASMSHVAGLFCISGATFCWWNYLTNDKRKYLWICSVLVALAILTRPQLAIFGILVTLHVGWRKGVWAAAPLFAGIFAGALVNLALWHFIFGELILIPQGGAFMTWGDPAIFPTLFSLRHGLVLWHPVYLIFLAGFLLAVRERELREFAVISLLIVLSQVYLNAATGDWWAGNSFGNRRFVDVVPLFAVGGILLARRIGPKLLLVSLCLLLIWNFLFIVQYRFGYIPRNEPVTVEQLIIDKFLLFRKERPY